MKAVIIILLIGIALLVWLNVNEPAQPFSAYDLPAKQLRAYMSRSTSTDDHPCLNRSRCLVLYMAPWCPACRQTKRFVPYVREAMAGQDAGLVVVVGKAWGNFNGGYDMARDIGGQVYIDKDSRYWNELRAEINAVPAWVTFRSDGSVVEKESGSPGRHDIHSAREFLNDML